MKNVKIGPDIWNYQRFPECQLSLDRLSLFVLLGTHLKYYFDEIQDMIEDVRTLKKAVLSTSIPSPPKKVILFYFTSNSTWSLYTMIYT